MKFSSDRFAFFRQSGWMMVATTTSGLLMFAVHIFAPWMPAAEYGLFGTLLQVMNLMMTSLKRAEARHSEWAATHTHPPTI